jgi:hypothetical protein
MSMHRVRAGLLLLAGLVAGGAASAQSPNGFASIVYVPLVVATGTFHSSLFVHNPGPAVNVAVTYHGGTLTADAGTPLDCGVHPIGAGATAEFDIATLCPLGGASNFGTLRVVEQDAGNPHPISVYSRVQSFTGNGFSTEGYPVGAFSDASGKSVVLGLRRDGAAPGYWSNCFASSIEEPVNVDMSLFDADNVQVGATHHFVLAAHETFRLLEVFRTVGAPDDVDFHDVRAEFSLGAGNVGNPSYAAFCTVQNNTSFDADFRLAKTVAPDDQSHLYSVTQTKDGLGNNLAVPPASKLVFAMFLQHPDFLSCRSIGDGQDNTEIQLKDPSGAIVGGGDGIKAIPKFYLGDKAARGNGGNGIWTLEVGSRDGLGETQFNIQCKSGSGMSRPLVVGSLPDDF